MILEAEGTVRWRVICDLHLIILDNQRTLSDKISRLPRANFSRFFLRLFHLGLSVSALNWILQQAQEARVERLGISRDRTETFPLKLGSDHQFSPSLTLSNST